MYEKLSLQFSISIMKVLIESLFRYSKFNFDIYKIEESPRGLLSKVKIYNLLNSFLLKNCIPFRLI